VFLAYVLSETVISEQSTDRFTNLYIFENVVATLVLTHLALTGHVTGRYAMHLVTTDCRSSSSAIYDLVTVKLGHLIKHDECKGKALR
jgi:hypothetical protein